MINIVCKAPVYGILQKYRNEEGEFPGYPYLPELYLPEQHNGVIPVDEPVPIEIETTYRFVLLYPASVPEVHNSIVPVCESVGV